MRQHHYSPARLCLVILSSLDKTSEKKPIARARLKISERSGKNCANVFSVLRIRYYVHAGGSLRLPLIIIAEAAVRDSTALPSLANLSPARKRLHQSQESRPVARYRPGHPRGILKSKLKLRLDAVHRLGARPSSARRTRVRSGELGEVKPRKHDRIDAAAVAERDRNYATPLDYHARFRPRSLSAAYRYFDPLPRASRRVTHPHPHTRARARVHIYIYIPCILYSREVHIYRRSKRASICTYTRRYR